MAVSLKRWHGLNLASKAQVNGGLVPDQNQEIFLYQTMPGGLAPGCREVPAFKERLKNYLLNAAREAMVHTRWVSPQVEHEKGLLAFVDRILDESENQEFLRDFHEMQSRLAFWSIKLLIPGSPQDRRDGIVGFQPGGSRQPAAGGFRHQKATLKGG